MRLVEGRVLTAWRFRSQCVGRQLRRCTTALMRISDLSPITAPLKIVAPVTIKHSLPTRHPFNTARGPMSENSAMSSAKPRIPRSTAFSMMTQGFAGTRAPCDKTERFHRFHRRKEHDARANFESLFRQRLGSQQSATTCIEKAVEPIYRFILFRQGYPRVPPTLVHRP